MNILFKKTRYICLYLLILCFFLTFIGCNKPQAEVEGEDLVNSSEEEPAQKELLPQLERISEGLGNNQESSGNVLDPFSGSLRLTGILIAKTREENKAIIESTNTSYIVKSGDIVAGYWDVHSVESTSVLLKNKDDELTLELKGN